MNRRNVFSMLVSAVMLTMASNAAAQFPQATAEQRAAGDRVTDVRLDVQELVIPRGSTVGVSAVLLDDDGNEVSGALETSHSKNGIAPFHSYATDCGNVFIMPTGRVNPREGVPLVSSERIARLMKRALEDFDIVVLDCPPLLPVADTHVIGDSVDASILVVRAGTTPKEVLEQALLEFGREKFFAAVLNRARPHNIPYFHEVYGYHRRPRP